MRVLQSRHAFAADPSLLDGLAFQPRKHGTQSAFQQKRRPQTSWPTWDWETHGRRHWRKRLFNFRPCQSHFTYPGKRSAGHPETDLLIFLLFILIPFRLLLGRFDLGLDLVECFFGMSPHLANELDYVRAHREGSR